MVTRNLQNPVTVKVMITVKTYPTPSERHVETVCVAGVRIDTPAPEWVRLYPIPFRVHGFDYEFKKYQIVEVPLVARGTQDPRPESYSPVLDGFVLGEVLDTRRNWAKRTERMGGLIGERTSCELLRINRETPMNMPAPSLGLIKPREVRVLVKPGAPWRDNQLAKVRRAASPTLFDEAQIRNELEPMPYEMKFHYKCADATCRGHKQTNIDWELGAAAINWRKSYSESEIPKRLQEKWESMLAPDKDAHLYIGNQHQHRQSFSVLGVWAPKL